MKEIKSLTSLRGIAALAVVMQHFSTTAQKHASITIPSLVPHGYLAVDFFFVLSGFIMCYTYLATFKQLGWSAYPDFLFRRAIRLLPLNVFVTATLLVLGWISTQSLQRNIFFVDIRIPFDILTNLLMLQGLGIGRNMNGPAWSVSAEFLAYFSFPVLIFGVFSSRIKIVVLSTTAASAGLLFVAMSNSRLGLSAEDPLLGGMRCLSEFTWGMLAYLLWARPTVSAWLGRDRITLALLAATAALLVVRIDLLVVALFPFLIIAVAHNKGKANACLCAPVFYFLGLISYSLYLIHNAFRPVALMLIQAWHPQPLGIATALFFAAIGSLAVVPFAWLTYRWIEHPSREWLRGMAISRRYLSI